MTSELDGIPIECDRLCPPDAAYCFGPDEWPSECGHRARTIEACYKAGGLASLRKVLE